MICPYKRAAAGALSHATFRTNVPVKKTVTASLHGLPAVHFGGETAHPAGDDMGHSNDAVAPLGPARCDALRSEYRRRGATWIAATARRPTTWVAGACSTMRRMT